MTITAEELAAMKAWAVSNLGDPWHRLIAAYEALQLKEQAATLGWDGCIDLAEANRERAEEAEADRDKWKEFNRAWREACK